MSTLLFTEVAVTALPIQKDTHTYTGPWIESAVFGKREEKYYRKPTNYTTLYSNFIKSAFDRRTTFLVVLEVES